MPGDNDPRRGKGQRCSSGQDESRGVLAGEHSELRFHVRLNEFRKKLSERA